MFNRVFLTDFIYFCIPPIFLFILAINLPEIFTEDWFFLVFVVGISISIISSYIKCGREEKEQELINYLENRGFVKYGSSLYFFKEDTGGVFVRFDKNSIFFPVNVSFYEREELDFSTKNYKKVQERLKRYFIENKL